VPPDLAGDRGDREGAELGAAVGLEAVDRLDQTDRPDLDEVLDLLAAPCKPIREPPHERQVLLDQAVASGPVTVLVVAPQELARRRAARGAVGGQRNQLGPPGGRRAGRRWTAAARRGRRPGKRLWAFDQQARSRPRDRRQGVRTRLGGQMVSGSNLRHARSPYSTRRQW
jgi:hypothetical protein